MPSAYEEFTNAIDASKAAHAAGDLVEANRQYQQASFALAKIPQTKIGDDEFKLQMEAFKEVGNALEAAANIASVSSTDTYPRFARTKFHKRGYE